jgi:uncharacterized membrane protein YozB (DUF420 family)
VAGWRAGQILRGIGKIGNPKPKRKNDAMNGQQVNRASRKILIILSLAALLAVLSGYAQPAQTDEGTAAHIFQLSIVALAPTILLFLATADWRQPTRSWRPLAFAAVALMLAFLALYYLEHYRGARTKPLTVFRKDAMVLEIQRA